MDPYKPFCKHVVTPLWAKYEGSNYLEYLPFLHRSQYVDFELIRETQFDLLKNLLRHAYRNTQFYRSRFRKAGIAPEDIKSWGDFAKIPFLTKDDVRTQRDQLLAPNFDKYVKFCTSGSTGIPLDGYRNRSCQNFKRACGLRSNLWAGFDIGERIYCLYGNPTDKLSWKLRLRRNLLTRESFLDTLNVTPESMARFASLLLEKPPSLLWGHAHNLYLFACFLESEGMRDIRPKGMYSAGMVLHAWEREKVEHVFNCVLQDRYGCEEIGMIAAECKHQEGLHINTDDLYVEFVGSDGKPVALGQAGEVVVTDLSNYVMPFIRYRMGDMAVLTGHNCSCGRTQPLIERIEGRIADFLVTPDNRLISGISLTDHFGASIPGIAQIQIIQETRTQLTLKIVKAPGFDALSEKRTAELVEHFFGKQMGFSCQFVEQIPREASGKYRFTICKLNIPYIT